MNYEIMLLDEINAAQKAALARPMILGGSAGAAGGLGGPPGGFVGYLPQGRVAFDTTEAETWVTSGLTLVDNLDRIRYRIAQLESSSGVSGGHTIADSIQDFPQRSRLKFIGSGVTVTDDAGSDSTIVSISGVAGSGTLTLPASKVIVTNTLGEVSTYAPTWDETYYVMRWSDPAYTFPAISTQGIVVASDNRTPGANFIRASNSDTAGALNMVKFGGTLGSPSAMTSGYRLGSITMGGHYGAGIDFIKVRMAGVATQDWTDPNRGAGFEFWATPRNSNTISKVLVLNGDSAEVLVPMSGVNLNADLLDGYHASGLLLENQIHNATAKTTITGLDEFGIWDSVSSGLRKLTWTVITSGIWSAWGSLVNLGTAKTSLTDNDAFTIMDSAASNATKKVTWSTMRNATAVQGLFTHGNSGQVPAGTTYYMALAAYGLSAGLTNIAVTRACTAQKFRISTNGTQSATGTLVFAIYKNNATSYITITVPAGGAGTIYENLTDTASLAAGDSIQIIITNNASVSSAPITRCSLELVY